MIRIRTQRFPPGSLYSAVKRSSVEIISVDQATRRMRLLDPSRTEREHLVAVLTAKPTEEEFPIPLGHYTIHYTVRGENGFAVFWIEHP